MTKKKVISLMGTLTLIVFSMMIIHSCTKNAEAPKLKNALAIDPVISTAPSLITETEYASSDADVQKLTDQLQNAYNQIFALQSDDQVATFTFNTDLTALPEEAAIVPKSDDATVSIMSCTICGISSGIGCIKAFRDYMKDNNLTKMDFTVELVTQNGGVCAKITTKQFQSGNLPTDPGTDPGTTPTDPGTTPPVTPPFNDPNSPIDDPTHPIDFPPAIPDPEIP